MLSISLVPKLGNSSGGHFPHTGYLGITPVQLAGTCFVKIDDDHGPVLARSLSVRATCVEQRTAGVLASATDRVLWETTRTLWQAGEGGYEAYGTADTPFRLTILPDAVAAVSAMHGGGAQTLREWRVVWRLEAVMEYKPIPFVGHMFSRSYFLDLHDHRALPPSLPKPPASSPPTEMTLGAGSSAVQFVVHPLESACYGPGDTINVRVGVRSLDPSTSVRKVSFVLERRLELSDEKSPTREPSREPSPAVSISGSTPPPRSRLSAMFHRGLSPKPNYARLPESQSPPPEAVAEASRVFTTRVAEGASDDPSTGPDGMCWPAVVIALPRRGPKWDVGHTVRTRTAAVSYDVRMKVALRTRSRAGAKDVCGPSIGVVLVGTSTAERTAAAGALASLLALEAAQAEERASLAADLAPKVKRRHRSSRRGLYMHEGTVDISESAVVSRGRRTRSRPSSPDCSPIPIHVPVPDAAVKPILLPPDHAVQTKAIQFDFTPRAVSAPSPPASSKPVTLPSIQSMINPYPTPASSHSSLSPQDISDHDSLSILRQFQSTGRRISTTNSEEEEVQPFRSRQRLSGGPPTPTTASLEPGPSTARRALPSLDALGLGLPQVPDDGRPTSAPRRRPRTAPAFGVYSISPPPSFGQSSGGLARPMTAATGSVAGAGGGSSAHGVQQPSRRAPPPGLGDGAFAFSVEAPDDATPVPTPTLAQHPHLLPHPLALAPIQSAPQDAAQRHPTLPSFSTIGGPP